MWPVNIKPQILERQQYLQSRKELVYLRKPGSRVMFAAYLGLLGVSVGGSLIQLVRYCRGTLQKAN